jgi:hypothetical protein
MNRHARVSPPATYDGDFHQWAVEQGRALRSKNPDSIDWDNVAEEIETLGRSQKSELRSRMRILIMHLLKWQFQPTHRSHSWQSTISEQRVRIDDLIADSPSLRSFPQEIYPETWQKARRAAALETGMDIAAFPADPGFSCGEVLDFAFLPKAPADSADL